MDAQKGTPIPFSSLCITGGVGTNPGEKAEHSPADGARGAQQCRTRSVQATTVAVAKARGSVRFSPSPTSPNGELIGSCSRGFIAFRAESVKAQQCHE